MARQAKDVAQQYAGGSGNLMKAVAESEAAAGISHGTEEQEWRRKSRTAWVRQFREAAGNDPLSPAYIGNMKAAERYQRQLDDVNEEIRKANVGAAQMEVGAFLTGDPLAIRRMQGRARQAPGRFAGVGPGGVTAAEAIANLPPSMEEAQRRSAADEDAKRLDDEEKELSERFKKRRQREKKARDDAGAKRDAAAREHQQAVAEQSRLVGPAFDDRLEATFYETGKLGGDLGQSAKAARGDVMAGLRGRNVPADLVSEVADAIIEKARQSALNKISSGEKPRLVREEDTAAAKTEREGKSAAAKEERERLAAERAAPARQRRAAAGAYAQEFQARAWSGEGVAVSGAQAQQAGQVIERMVAAGTDVDTAMQQTFNQMAEHARQGLRTMLKVQAGQEAMLGIVGPNIAQLRMLEGQQDQINARIRGVQQNARRPAIATFPNNNR